MDEAGLLECPWFSGNDRISRFFRFLRTRAGGGTYREVNGLTRTVPLVKVIMIDLRLQTERGLNRRPTTERVTAEMN